MWKGITRHFCCKQCTYFAGLQYLAFKELIVALQAFSCCKWSWSSEKQTTTILNFPANSNFEQNNFGSWHLFFNALGLTQKMHKEMRSVHNEFKVCFKIPTLFHFWRICRVDISLFGFTQKSSRFCLHRFFDWSALRQKIFVCWRSLLFWGSVNSSKIRVRI